MKGESYKSPGWARMMDRLGPEGAEALRQDVLRRQEEALRGVRIDMGVEKADRSRDRARPKKSTDYPGSK